MTGGRQGKGKEVASISRNSEFVSSAIHQTFGSPGTHSHGGMTLSSPTSQIPSSRASDAMESSHIPDSAVSSGTHHLSTNDVQKIFIRPRRSNKFDKQMQCTHKIRELIDMRFEGAWKSWSKFPQNTKNLIFSEFGGKQIRNIFDTCAMNFIKNRMYQIRQKKKKPEWLDQRIFEDLNQIFLQDEFKSQSERNKENRASDCDGHGFPLHVGGCVSHSEHIDRMVVGGPKKGVIYGLAGQNYNVMHGSSSSSRRHLAIEWECERTQMLDQMNDMQSSINELQTSFETRVEAAVEQRVEAMVEQRVEAAVEQRLSSMEARLMARFASFHHDMRDSSSPKSPSLR